MDVVIRDWTFTHCWVRPVVKMWFDIYHKSVTYSGTKNINWEKPIIFAPSHQNAFSDALCLILPTQYTENRFIYPLIRADAFGNNKAIDWILTAFHMLPVYRPRDKVDLKLQNDSVFSNCYDILAKKRNLLIHPEGNCIPEKRVRRFKKGLARIAFGAEEAYNFDLGVTVIPVGINYRKITESRKGIHVRYGAPIAVADFKDTYKQHPASAITQLTQEVKKGVKDVAINVASDRYYSLYETLFTLNCVSDPSFSEDIAYSKDELQSNQHIAHVLRENHSKDPEFIQKEGQKVGALKTILKRHRLDIDKPLVISKSIFSLTLEISIYLLLSPIIIYGWINNILPWYGIHKVAGNIDELQFRSSARMTLGLLLFPLCYMLQAVLFWSLSSRWTGTLLYLLSIPFTGILALNCWENFKSWKQQLRLHCLSHAVKRKINDLTNEIFSGI